MKLEDFDYHLPEGRIAQYPLQNREQAKLLVADRAGGKIGHRIFRDIVEYCDAGDLLVLNDTKVLPCRLLGKRASGGRVEALLLRQKQGLVFEALLKPGRLKQGERVAFNGGKLTAQITGKNEIAFEASGTAEVYAHGSMPLPPYVKRPAEAIDETYYQTVYAREEGAVAAPTAGLHFTREVLDKLRSKGVRIAPVTLHVGIGTFRPVKADDIRTHRMEKESFNVPEGTRLLIERTREEGGRIIAAGTTSVRVLETLAAGKTQGETDLFIYPGYTFRMVDCLLTNFHLPRTTLFMLVCAFCGSSLARSAYEEAVEESYRFYSYGDAMLII